MNIISLAERTDSTLFVALFLVDSYLNEVSLDKFIRRFYFYSYVYKVPLFDNLPNIFRLVSI